MTDAPSPSPVFAALSEHPHTGALAKLVCAAALDAAAARRADFGSRFQHAPVTLSVPPELSPEAAETPFGNVLLILQNGGETPEQHALLACLMAIGVARELPERSEEVQALTGHLIWLATHSPCNVFEYLEEALTDRAGVIWEAVARIARSPQLAAPDFGETEALVSAVALCRGRSEVAHRARLHLAQNTQDPVVKALLAGGTGPTELAGELGAPPFGPVVTTLLAVTLLLFLGRAIDLLLRFALAYRRPATLRIGPQGLELSHRTELMGRVIRDRSTLVPLANLSRVTREVRYARVGLYAGLAALVLGTYFGMGLIVDGVRVPGGSPPLLGMAVTCIVVGLGLDFLLSTAADSARGRCRIVIVPQKGRKLCVGALDPLSADAMLTRIAEHAHA